MKNRIYHNTCIVIILASYLLLSATGFIEALTIFGISSHSQQIEQARPGPLPTPKVYITQYKYVPTTVKNEVPSPAIIIEPVSQQVQPYGIFYTIGTPFICLDPLISLHSSRAPPLA
jgi:hypothetical protein